MTKLSGINVVVEHSDLAARSNWQHAVEPSRRRCLGNRGTAVHLVDHGPAPDVNHAADGFGIFAVHDHAVRSGGDVSRLRSNGHLLGKGRAARKRPHRAGSSAWFVFIGSFGFEQPVSFPMLGLQSKWGYYWKHRFETWAISFFGRPPSNLDGGVPNPARLIRHSTAILRKFKRSQ